MSWKETYNAWKNYQALEPDLKDELAKLEGNDEALEDAFYAPMEFGTADARRNRSRHQSNECLHGSSGN